MTVVDILKFGTLIYLVGIGVWFGSATPKFDKESRARPLLKIMVGTSLIATIATMAFVIPSPVPLARIIVTLAMATGVILLIKWAFRSIKKKNLGLVFSGIVPEEVVQHGPYRYVRHPLYTAYSIFWLSCAVFAGSILVAVIACVIIGLYVTAAKSEERDLLGSSLGTTYRTYQQRTGLMVPKLF